MSDYSERKLLHRLQELSEIEARPESTEQAMEKARHAITAATDPKNPAARKISRPIPRRRMLCFAGAAVALIVVVITVALIWNAGDDDEKTVVQKQVEPTPKTPVKKESPGEKPPSTNRVKDEPKEPEEPDSPEIEVQFNRIRAIANAGDIDGLIVVLREGDFPSKVIVAHFLMTIGDERAIEPLEELSGQWYGDSDANPFVAAVDAIRKRAARKDGGAGQEPPRTITGGAVAAGGAIAGIVVDDRGNPVAGARVTLLSAAGVLADPNDKSPPSAVVTAADGGFTIKNVRAGAATVKVFHDNYDNVTLSDIDVASGKVTGGVKFVFVSRDVVEGVVYDATGAAEANVTLYFQAAPASRGSAKKILTTAVTDDNGFYRVAGLGERMCYVRRSDDSSRLGVVRQGVMSAETGTRRLDFGGGPVVSGLIIIDDQPFADAQVVMSDPYSGEGTVFASYTRTDSDGLFVAHAGGAGRYGIFCRLPQAANRWTPLATVEMTGGDVDLGVISLTSDEIEAMTAPPDPNDITDSVDDAGKSALWVQAVADDGLPIIGADIWLTDYQGDVTPLKRTGEGSMFAVEAGGYTLHAAFPGFAEAQVPVQLEQNDISAARSEKTTLFIRLDRQ